MKRLSLFLSLFLLPVLVGATPVRPLIKARAVSPVIVPLMKPLLLGAPLFLLQEVCGTAVSCQGPGGGGVGGSGCVPAGALGEVLYSNGAGACSSEAAFAYNAATNFATLAGGLIVPDGSEAIPSLQLGATGKGFYFVGGVIYASSTALTPWAIDTNNGAVRLASLWQPTWSSTNTATGTSDTGLSREAAGVVGLTNGTTGAGSLRLRDSSGANHFTLSPGDHTANRSMTVVAGTNVAFTLDSGLFLFGGSGVANRTITAGTGIAVANGDGVSGNPTPSADTATTPQFSSGPGSAPGTGALGTFYLETDAEIPTVYTDTNTPRTLLTRENVNTIESTLNYCADAGASDTYACSLAPAIVAYTTGACYTFKANTANTGAATLNLNSLGAKTVKKAAGGITTDLADNDIRSGQQVDVCYDGTNLQMQSGLGNAGGGSLDINGLTAEPLITIDDTLPFYDVSATANRKITQADSNTQVGRKFWMFEEDFIASPTAQGVFLLGGSSGAGADTATIAGEAGRLGIRQLSTGTTTTGAAGFITYATNTLGVLSMEPGGGRIHFTAWVRFPTLSDGTETYKGWLGLTSCTFSISCVPADAVAMTYTHSENSGKWRLNCTEDSATTNVDDTGTAVTAAQWYRVEYEINAGATSVEAFVDGTSIGSCGTNVPDSGDDLSPHLFILKSAGTTSRSMDIDAARYFGELTTAR